MVYNITSKPEWRNWQTRCLEGAVPVRACGFDSRLRHEKRKAFKMYVWEYEEIQTMGVETKFVVVDVLDFPVELVSRDGKYYALYIRDTEDGELWFLIENLPNKLLADYLKGNKPIGDLFKSGKVSIVKRPYENLGLFIKTDYSLQDFELPDKSLKMEIEDLEVFEGFRSMLDKPFRNLLKVNSLNYRLKKSIKKSLENKVYAPYSIGYEKGVDIDLLQAA